MLNAGQLENRFPEDATSAEPQADHGPRADPACAAPNLAPHSAPLACAGHAALPAAAHAPFLVARAAAGPLSPLRRRGEALLKRSFDLAFAAVFLVVALPFLAVLCLALRVDSPGPLFFVQRRVGRDGALFGCIKFRTMRVDADAALARLLATCPASRAEWEADHKLRNDPRVSRLGCIVRKLSLDELPQLINILRGEMSVVGPRPIVQAEIPRYGAAFADYCAVRPGLTGLWQVSGRNDTTYAARVRLDSEYRRRANFLFDLGIVLRTVPAVLFAQGSY